MIRPLSLLFAAGLLVGQLAAQATRADSFAQAREQSQKENRPIAVLIHGKSWHRASRLLYDQVWADASFLKGLQGQLIVTSIELPQFASEEEEEARKASLGDWNRKTTTTFPAVQIYGADGHLLKTYQGREFLEIAISPESLSQNLEDLYQASQERDRLLRELEGSNSDTAPGLIDALNQLGFNPEPDAVQKYLARDPNDQSGWAAKLSFKDWNYIRDLNTRIERGEAAAALTESEELITNPHLNDEQRSLIKGGQGILLHAMGKKEEAWQAFLAARELDRSSINGLAMLRHGYRIVGQELRESLPPDFQTKGVDIGGNLSRESATLTVSSEEQGVTPERPDGFFEGVSPEFAFHTKSEKGPHAIIDLGAPVLVTAIQIENRKNWRTYDRANGLSISLSPDGETWTEAWRMSSDEKAGANWEILLTKPGESPIESRFVRLALPNDREGILHLSSVNVFGHPSVKAAE